jgi:DNA replication protein DnaC
LSNASRSGWTSVNPTEGFLLTGRVGNGKTHLVRGVAHQMRAHYRTVLYTTVPYLLEHLRGPTGVDMDAVLKATTRADVVMWDDLGAEKPSDWALDRLYLLLDARYEVEKPLLATSNLSPGLLEERVGARIVSRLMEMGSVWEVPGADYRLLLARKRLAAG